VRASSCARGLLNSLVSMFSLTFVISSMAGSHEVERISEASFPHVAASSLSLSLDCVGLAVSRVEYRKKTYQDSEFVK